MHWVIFQQTQSLKEVMDFGFAQISLSIAQLLFLAWAFHYISLHSMGFLLMIFRLKPSPSSSTSSSCSLFWLVTFPISFPTFSLPVRRLGMFAFCLQILCIQTNSPAFSYFRKVKIIQNIFFLIGSVLFNTVIWNYSYYSFSRKYMYFILFCNEMISNFLL